MKFRRSSKVRSYLPARRHNYRNTAKIRWRVVDAKWGTCYAFTPPGPDEISSLRIRPVSVRRRKAYAGWNIDKRRFVVEGRRSPWRRARKSMFWNRFGWRLVAYG